MPTSHHIPIVPGTLCWLRAPVCLQDRGKVVEVLRLHLQHGLGGKQWIAKAQTEVYVVALGTNHKMNWPAGSEFAVCEACLVPIAGPGLVDEVECFDFNSQLETIGQLLREAGLAIRPLRKTVTER